LTAVLVLASESSLAGCQGPPAAHDRYRLTGTETVTDAASGIRRQVKHWQYEDGHATTTTRKIYDPQGGRPQRGTKAH
jgi:hypothetical protein